MEEDLCANPHEETGEHSKNPVSTCIPAKEMVLTLFQMQYSQSWNVSPGKCLWEDAAMK